MLRRLYFVLPNVDSARQTANDLLLARVEDRRMHFLARRGTDLGELREASALQKTDFVHSAELGMVLGGIGGLLIGGFMVLTPPDGMTVPMVTVAACSPRGSAVRRVGSKSHRRIDSEQAAPAMCLGYRGRRCAAHARCAGLARRRDTRARPSASSRSERRGDGTQYAGIPLIGTRSGCSDYAVYTAHAAFSGLFPGRPGPALTGGAFVFKR
jgi:hypothetical protein